jgi:hypothetical protein
LIESACPRTDNNRHFSDALQSLAAEVASERLEFGTISQFMGSRSIGALLLFFALPMVLPIPMPGISIVFGIPLIVIAIQLLFGHRHAWLPARLARRSIARIDLSVYIQKALPTLHRIESVLRPRIEGLTGNKAMRLVGAVCLILALIITLPVPFGHLVPGLAISTMALGLIERDGLMVGAGLLIALIALLIVALAMTGLAAVGRAFI